MLACASLAFAALPFSACGSSGERTATSSTVAQSAAPTPTQLVVKDLAKGNGPELPPISHTPRVTMRLAYTAVEYGTEKVFEKHDDPGHPAKVEYGPGLSRGLRDGLAGMKVGGRRELVIPASMTVNGQALVYAVRLLGFKKNGTKIYARALRRGEMMSKREIANLPPLTIPKQSGPPPRHIKIIDLRRGTGAPIKKWDEINVRYYEISYSKLEERSRSGRYGPQSYGLEDTIRGWRVGVPGMRVGGRRELILPPKLVYPRWKPSWGYAPFTRIYLIDLIGVKPPTDPYSKAAALLRRAERNNR